MKRLCLLATLLLTPALHAQPKASVKAAASMIVFTWNYDYSAVPVCTGALQNNCIHHFILSEGASQVTIPATTATNYQFNLTPLPSPGNHNYSLVAVETLTGTATISSNTANVNVNVPAGPPMPTNFTAVPQ